MPTTDPAAGPTDQVRMCNLIRAAILKSEFVPNQRMTEADLCVQFDASRAAVCAALQDLVSEGLVERIQNRGARVRSISQEEAAEITEVRMVIEGSCAPVIECGDRAAKAAKNATAAEIDELTALGAALTTPLLRPGPPTRPATLTPEDLLHRADRVPTLPLSRITVPWHRTTPATPTKLHRDRLQRTRYEPLPGELLSATGWTLVGWSATPATTRHRRRMPPGRKATSIVPQRFSESPLTDIMSETETSLFVWQASIFVG
jgi:hypothetical protein